MRRLLLADPWPWAGLALLVLLATCALTLAPRAMEAMRAAQLDREVSGLSVLQRDLISVQRGSAGAALGQKWDAGRDVGSTWGTLIDGLEGTRASQQEPLRSLLGEGRFLADVGTSLATDPGADSDLADLQLQPRVDPFLPEYVDLVEGDWPGPTPGPAFGPQGPGGMPEPAPVDVLLSADAAEQLSWEVGEVRGPPDTTVTSGPLVPSPVRLSGIYAPVDGDHPHWQHSTNGAGLGVLTGSGGVRTGIAAAYLHPANPGFFPSADERFASVVSYRLRLWYPLAAEHVPGNQVPDLISQLGGFTAAAIPLVPEQPNASGGGASRSELTVEFDTLLPATLVEVVSQQRVTTALLGLMLAGPVALVLVVLGLSGATILRRRHSAVWLAQARGASPRQVRGLAAALGALVGLLSALLGLTFTHLAWPGPVAGVDLVAVGAGALVPAAALGAAGHLGDGPSRRFARLRHGPRHVLRAATVLLVTIALLAVWRLLDRGGISVASDGLAAEDAPLIRARPDAGLDLLAAATPGLVVLAACLLGLQLHRLPIRALHARLRRGRRLVGFLGSARALRGPPGGVVPTLAVALGMAVALSSAVLLSTVSQGAERAAWTDTGAELRLSGPSVDDELSTTLAEVPGVAAVSVLREVPSPVDLEGEVAGSELTVYVVDTTLPSVQWDASLAPLPEALFGGSGPLPVLTGGEAPEATGPTTLPGLGAARVVGHVESLAGLRTDQSFLVVERERWEAAGGSTPAGSAALMAVGPASSGTSADAHAEEVAERVRAAVPNSLVETVHAGLADFREAPVVDGLTVALAAATVSAVALAAVALLLNHLLQAPARHPLLATLRTLGMGRHGARRLIAWESGPLVLTASLVGVALGVGVPWLLLQAIDLTSLTGGAAQPPLRVDPLTAGAGVLAVLLTALAATALSSVLAARTDLAQQLRIGRATQ